MPAPIAKLFSTGVAIAMLAGLSVASATAKSHETVTLNLLMASTQQPGFTILIANFERVYPDIKINATYIPSPSLPQLLLTQFQAGNAPDLYHMLAGRNGITAVLLMAESGRLLPLGNEIWVKRLPGYVKPAMMYKGKPYAYPYALYAVGVAYNIDMFKQIGVKVPTTFAQVLAMCKKISAAGKFPFVQGFSEANNAGLFPQQRMIQYVYSKTKNWDDLRDQKKVSFASSPEWRRSFQSILDMKDAGCFQPGAQGTSAAQEFSTFARGDAAMALMASTQFGNVTTINPTIKAGFFNLPADSPAQSQVILNGSFIGINAQTKHPAEAKTFIHFLSRPKQAALFAKISGGNSYYDILKNVLPPYMSDLAPLLKAGKAQWAPHTQWPNPSINSVVLGSGIQGLFTGQKTIDDLLKSMDYMWDNPTATSGP
jgi:raffinose/stachyose/melibiose transport system substrate-binding protein